MEAVRDATHENRQQFVYVCGANVTAQRDLSSGFDTVDNCRELIAKRAVRKRGFRAIDCDGEPRLKKRQQSDHVATPWTLLRFVQERGGEHVLGKDKVWCHRAVVAVQSNPVLDVHYIALRTVCPQRDEACVLGNTHALFRRVKLIFSGRDQALLSSLLVRLSSKRRQVHRRVASLIVGYFCGIMSKSDLCSLDLPTTAQLLAAPSSESPERLPAAKASNPGKVLCQNGDPAEQVTPAKRPYEMHSTNSAERSGPRSKVSKLSLTYAQREKSMKAQNGTPPVPASASSDTPVKEAVVPSDVSAKETTVRRKLGPLLVDACKSVSESTATPTPLPEKNSAAADAEGRAHSEDSSSSGNSSARDPSGHTTTEPVGSVQKQAASVASHLPTAFANWAPTTVFSSKLGSQASGRSLAIRAKAVSGNSVKGGKVVSNGVAALNASSSPGSACGNERQVVVPEESARSPISIPSISSTSAPCEVPGSEGTQGEPDARDAVHSNVTAKDDTALVWCECGFGPFDRGAFEAHSLTTHVKPFCHGCNLCGEKFAARKDLKCHFAVHSQVRESLSEDDPKLSKGVAGRNESRTPNARNSPPGANLLSPVDRVAEMTDNTDPADPSRGRAHWFLRPDLDGSRTLIRFFKCVVGECKYTTDLPADFSSHLSSHRLKEMGDLVCIYCGEDFDAIATLVQHMERIHRNLTFQCGHCLYRSALPIHNHLHHGWFHRHQELLFFTCENPGLHANGVGLPTQHVSLTHYWCSITNCDFKSFNPDVFEWHLSAAHPKTKKYSCYNCEERVNSPQALLQHCVKHDMDVVQCGVCHHSEPSFRKMLRHLCEHHPDSPLELSFRTNGQAAEFEKYVRKLQVSFERSAANMHESADSSSDVDGMPVSTPQSLYKRCEPEDAVLRTARSSVKTCPFCTHRLVSLEDLTEHCVIGHQISLGISAILELMLKTKQHAAAARDESLSCPFCDTAPSDKDELERHMYEEFEYAPMQCEACGYSTFRREVLKEHFRMRHPQRRPAFTVRRHDDFESWVAGFVAAQEARRTILEKPYQCVHCNEGLRCTKELRMHLYAHLQYYPHHCTICEKCFTSQQEVQEHQRALHAATDVYSIEEVRFENKEVKVDDLIDEATAKLRAVVESPPGRQCMWMGCPYSSSNPAELVAHMKAHIEQRKVCTTCQFSSYCDDILAWHSRQHSPVSSSTEVLLNPAPTSPVPKVKSRAYACCWCNYRGPSSMEIRTHCKTAHPGKAVKLVAPKRKDLHAPTARRVSTDLRRREDVINGVDEGAGMDEAMIVEERRDVVAPPVRDVVVCERQPVHAGTRVDSSQLATCTMSGQQLKCGQCQFLAPSLRLLRLHESILHAGCAVTSASGINLASAVSKVLAWTAEEDTAVPSVRQDQRPAVVCEPGASSRLTSRAARGESTCKKCFKHFQSKLLLYHHLVLVHHVYAVCNTCGGNLMSKTNAQVHVSVKHLPELATFTLLRSKELATLPLPAAAVSRDAGTPPSASVATTTTENDSLYVCPLDSCDEPVPFHVYTQQHNVNPHVCLKDIAKLYSSA